MLRCRLRYVHDSNLYIEKYARIREWEKMHTSEHGHSVSSVRGGFAHPPVTRKLVITPLLTIKVSNCKTNFLMG